MSVSFEKGKLSNPTQRLGANHFIIDEPIHLIHSFGAFDKFVGHGFKLALGEKLGLAIDRLCDS